MKFKAKLTPQQTNLLYNLIHPISRLHPSSTSSSSSLAFSSPSTILYLDNDKLVLSTRGGSASTSSNSNPSSSFNHASSSFTYTQSNNAHTNDAEGIFCFAELITKDGIFKELIIQSLENDNAILMDIHIGQLRTALRGVLNAQLKYMKENSGGKVDIASANNINGVSGPELTIKLAKRNGGMPHLCLDVKDYHNNNSSSNNNRQIPQAPGSSMSRMIGVHHAIPVRMMRVEELQYHVPPRLGMPDVQLELPRDRPLKNVVDRLRSISPHVYLEGSMKGLLSLRIDGDGASIRTTFTKLIPIHEDCKSSTQQSQVESNDNGTTQQSSTSQPNNQQEQLTTCTIKVDSKKLHASLHWQGTLHMIRDVSSAVLCMWENEMLVLDVTLNPDVGRFMYYIPVHYLSADWD